MKKLLVLLAITLLMFGCKPPEKKVVKEAKAKPAMPVEVKTVTKTKIKREIYATSTAEGAKESYVAASTGGIITRVNFKMGDYVKKGSLLLSVESRIQKASVTQAEASVEMATLSMDIAEKLQSSGNTTKLEYVNAKTQLKSAKAALSQAKKTYEDCFIRAPFSGHIASKNSNISKGALLPMGGVIARIINIRSLKGEFQIGEMEIPIVKEGMVVDLEIPAVGIKKIEGKILALSSASDPQSGSFPVEVVWDNKDELVKSGMSVNIAIRSVENDSVLVVPAAAIFMKGDKKAIFVEQNGRVALRYIKTGRATKNLLEVISGVDDGAKVIVSGMTVLTGGDAVVTTNAGATGDSI